MLVATMRYDAFKQTFIEAVRASDLREAAFPIERLDVESLDRHFEMFVEPIGGQDAAPFHVTASLAWVWSAIMTARFRSTEEDLLTELLGAGAESHLETDPPVLRVDLALRATIRGNQRVSLPLPDAWARWAHETVTRLDRVEPMLPRTRHRKIAGGRTAILAWQGAPDVRATCTTDGALLLDCVAVRAFQLVQLPRQWDDPDRPEEPGPERELEAMAKRVKASLNGWTQALDHLTAKPRKRA